MGVMDRFLNAMRLNSDEDEDYYDDDFYDDEEDEEDYDASRRSRFRGRKNQDEDFDEGIPVYSDSSPSAPKAMPQQTGSGKVTQLRAVSRKSSSGSSGGSMAVCVIKPISVEEAREITETLLAGRTVVLNLEGLDLEVAQRIIDFTSGSCYAINGNLQKISTYIFIITPSNVDVSGDFQNLVSTFGGSAPGMQSDI